ncbi:MAG: M28 family peptidase [Mycobacterium sp.]|nr:M28 family peptidase [Mycobacterium sp.]
MKVAALLLTLLTATACSSAAPPAAAPEPVADRLAAAVSADAMFTHLTALQEIADGNGGNRADGTSGFEASVDYVVQALKDKGFEVSTPEFERLDAVSPGKPTLTAGGRSYPVDQASLLLQTPVGGVSGPVLLPARTAGCVTADYRAGAARGGIAVVDDTGCSVVDKQQAAAAAGAAALVVISSPGRNGSPPGLFVRGYYEALAIPVAIAGSDAGTALRRTSSPVRLVLDAKTVKVRSRNVVAQTKTGSTHDVVLVGAHLDGPATGPGINNNGSGVAAALATALALGPSPEITNAVRFAFWGGSQERLAGSLNYVAGLDREALNDIALYVNCDQMGSPNAGFFTYDGDQSGPASPDIGPEEVPVGSAGVERVFAGYLNLAGKRPADMPLSVASDDSAFLHAGVPVGGITTGATGVKTTTQARLWGGKAGVPFDPDYGTVRDDLAAVNRDALAVTGAGVAFAVGTYAVSIDGVNGVPPHDKRHRTPTGP